MPLPLPLSPANGGEGGGEGDLNGLRLCFKATAGVSF